MTARIPRLWLASVAALTLLIAQAAAEPIIIGKVVGIQDGDTLTLLDDSEKQQRIRLAGIDAPEKGQPFGNVSKENLSAIAFGQFVTADCPKVDRYGRLVCVVRVNGTDVSLLQVKSGLAWHYKQYAHEQSPDYRTAYADAEVEARMAKKGLWADPKPMPPWEWRHRK